MVGLRFHLDISSEAAARCLVDRHAEPIAAIVSANGKIRYAVRGKSFPWIDRSAGQMVSSLSLTARAVAKGSSVVTRMQEVPAASWTSADIPELFEQVRVGKEGHALTLLWATLPEVDRDGADDD